jgi:hypothetical protein
MIQSLKSGLNPSFRPLQAKQGALAEGADRVEALARELEIVREALPAAWR